MKKKIRLLSCLIISMLMLVMVVPKRIFADEGPINRAVTDPSKNVDEKHGDITGEDAVTLLVDGTGTKIQVDAGNVTASDDGVSATAYNGGKIITNVEKIEAGGEGVFATASSTGSTVDITAKDVEAKKENGIHGSASSGGAVNVNAGNVETKSTNFDAVSVSADGTESVFDVTTKEIKSNHNAITASASGGGNLEAVAESVIASNKGIDLVSNTGGTAKVTTKDISAGDAGVVFTADNNQKTNININTGAISSVSYGIKGSAGSISDTNGGSSIVINSGKIETKNDHGVFVENNYGNSIEINVKGDITANGENSEGTYIYAGENATLSVVATGTISGSIGADISGDGAKKLDVQAKEIKGDDIGVLLSIRKNDSNATVTADTISGDNVSIGLYNYFGDQSEKGTTVIAWKIELNDKGHVAENTNLEDRTKDSVNENFELNNILYLLKIEQPAEGGTISLESDDERYSYSEAQKTGVANEKTKVYVKVDVNEGYTITGVYNGKGEKQALLKDDKGYYIEVPKGGGVYLTAELSLNQLKIIDETKDPHEIGGGQSHFVEVDADINDFKQALIDNVDVTKHAKVTEGSTIVTFDPSFLDTLSVGEHDLMLKFRIGIASTKLRVIDNNPDNNPSSDSNNTGFAIPKTGIEDMQKTSSAYKGYMIASFAVAAAIVTFKRNRKNLVK